MIRRKMLVLVCALACVAIAIPIFGQRGGTPAPAADPLTGIWTGDWGPSERDRNTVSVDLKLAGTALTGTVKSIQPARADVMLQKSTFNAATGAVHMEAESTSPRGGAAVRFIIDGTLTNGKMKGSWNHDAVKGDFNLTKTKAP